MKVLHLSDSPLSGAPIRISNLLGQHSKIESRHIVWSPQLFWRSYDTDLIGSQMPIEELERWLGWADVLHFHNRWQRQEIFKRVPFSTKLRLKPAVIQIHSPRESEDFSEELGSGLPIACVAQYHPRQWPEKKFIVPNVVDITSARYWPNLAKREAGRPCVSYAPSNTNGRGWDDKSYSVVGPVLKRMKLAGEIVYDLIIQAPHEECLFRKTRADVGIDEISTGSYHLSSLEYLAMGIACIGYLDDQTAGVVKELTGATKLPWIQTPKAKFKESLQGLLADQNYVAAGKRSREWMEKFWNPGVLCEHYRNMYEAL